MSRASRPSKLPRRDLPTALQLFAWAVAQDQPTLAQAAHRFMCGQAYLLRLIEDAEGTLEPEMNLSLSDALGSAGGITPLKGGERIIEAYYAT